MLSVTFGHLLKAFWQLGTWKLLRPIDRPNRFGLRFSSEPYVFDDPGDLFPPKIYRSAPSTALGVWCPHGLHSRDISADSQVPSGPFSWEGSYLFIRNRTHRRPLEEFKSLWTHHGRPMLAIILQRWITSVLISAPMTTWRTLADRPAETCRETLISIQTTVAQFLICYVETFLILMHLWPPCVVCQAPQTIWSFAGKRLISRRRFSNKTSMMTHFWLTLRSPRATHPDFPDIYPLLPADQTRQVVHSNMAFQTTLPSIQNSLGF